MQVPTCPICGRPLEGPITEWPRFPFCSDKCKLIDLGRWLDGSYVNAIPAEEPEGDLPDGP
jgi:endogenous inhibitor of DNA gyrase (YacG/DUF329 family)